MRENRVPTVHPAFRVRNRHLSRFLLLVALGACSSCQDDATVAPVEQRGSLALTISGLPAAQTGAVMITGPGQFSREATASTTIADLVTGAYTVTAQAVAAAGVSYQPTPPTQTVTVAANTQATASVAYAAAPIALRAQLVAQGMLNPVYLTAPAGDSRLFIVEQAGRIRIFKNGALLPTPFLDITSRVTSGGERGLLSMAFDPAYATNGRFYIYYTGAEGDIFVDRQTVSANPDVANTAFQQVITVSHQQAANHNGGMVMFGPDGMLYIGTGDGGNGGDPLNNAQNTSALLGKILRLDVSTIPYTIPAGNPFVGTAGSDEIWAYGLRNPWRFAFDGQGTPAKLYVADVGQNAWEEVNVVDAASAGVNYGWRVTEATHCFNPATGCNTAGMTLPILEYNHDQGCSITGGFVYRGSAMPELRGHYFYSDYCNGWLRSFRLVNNAAADRFEWAIGGIGNVTSFGVDGSGELYMLTSSGSVYRIARQ